MNRRTWPHYLLFTVVMTLIVTTNWQHIANAAGSRCDAIDHRAGGGSDIDDNTLQGVRDNARKGFRSELDGRVLRNGYTIFHENRWEQYTTGTGTPETSTVAYVKTIRTLDNNQRVPLMGDVITAVRRLDGRVLMEMDEPDAWTRTAIRGLVKKLRAHNVMDQWTFTATDPTLGRLKVIAPHAQVMKRASRDDGWTVDRARKYGVDGFLVGTEWGRRLADKWRSRGYKVWGRQAGSDEYRAMFGMGVRTLQTGTPARWEHFCRSRAS